MNSVVLVGRLTRNPDIRDTTTETAMTVLRLAVPRGRDDDEPVFVDVVCFGRQALSAGTFLTKGRLVGVSGRLGHREWTASNGRRRSHHEIVAHSIEYLDGAPRVAERPAATSG